MRRGRVPELGIFLLGYQLLQTIGIRNIPPVTITLIVTQVAVYLQFLVVPRLCLSAETVYHHGDYLRLVVPAIRHTNDIHLYYNMISLAWKGISLERRFGSLRFLITVAILTVLSSVIYVGLALVASDILEDYSYMNQCAIGFSGVLFALKVLTTHYDHAPRDRTSYFGFLLPVRYAVWVELIVIQLIVPNASFLGHLAGILAGIVYVKGPLRGILSLLPVPSLLPSSCLATLLLSAGQLGLHLGLVPGWSPTVGCVPTRQFMTVDTRRLSLVQVKGMFLAPLHHMSLLHLLINLASLHVKGRRLEGKLGMVRYLLLAVASVLGTTVGRAVLELTGDNTHLPHCVVGLSGALFAMKVLTVYHTDSIDMTLLFELGELAMLVEKSHRLFHVAGLLTGVVLLLFSNRRPHVWEGRGRVLGGGYGHGGQQQPQPEVWTRSWGYGGGHMSDQEQLEEMMERSRRTYMEEQYLNSRGFTPSAPPAPEEDRPAPRRYNPDQPVTPPPDPIPPRRYQPGQDMPSPPGQGYQRFGSTASPDVVNAEELRRRRLERFS